MNTRISEREPDAYDIWACEQPACPHCGRHAIGSDYPDRTCCEAMMADEAARLFPDDGKNDPVTTQSPPVRPVAPWMLGAAAGDKRK